MQTSLSWNTDNDECCSSGGIVSWCCGHIHSGKQIILRMKIALHSGVIFMKNHTRCIIGTLDLMGNLLMTADTADDAVMCPQVPPHVPLLSGNCKDSLVAFIDIAKWRTMQGPTQQWGIPVRNLPHSDILVAALTYTSSTNFTAHAPNPFSGYVAIIRQPGSVPIKALKNHE